MNCHETIVSGVKIAIQLMHSLICSSHWLFNCMRANTDQMWLGYTTQTTNGNQKSCPLLTDSTFLSVKIGFRQSHYFNLGKYSMKSVNYSAEFKGEDCQSHSVTSSFMNLT